ncbi:SDR family oxidoreductase [Acerihabitans sp. KWT182]|uniref:SDR family oxidoreductase n=1 Tax=Acerihabitans sp. KWT182 TaxID=3157919 RepID=A0AAU7QFR8_9GAMM
MSLEGKTVLVIGGSSGIGQAVSRKAARLGARLLLVARDSAKLESAATELRRQGAQVTTQAMDAADPQALARFCAAAEDIDHAISMVGGAMGGGFLANSEEAVRQAIEEKFFAALRIARAIAPKLHEGGSLTLTSGAGGRPHSASGAIVGNAAIRTLAEGLAVELAPRIRVNAVAPTWMDTPLWRNVPREQTEQTRAYFNKTIPLGRTATTDEVADAYLFAMTCTFLTGHTLVIDGGGWDWSPDCRRFSKAGGFRFRRRQTGLAHPLRHPGADGGNLGRRSKRGRKI